MPSFKGKLIGAGIGAFLGGPLGAMIGGMMGHYLHDLKPGRQRPGILSAFTLNRYMPSLFLPLT